MQEGRSEQRGREASRREGLQGGWGLEADQEEWKEPCPGGRGPVWPGTQVAAVGKATLTRLGCKLCSSSNVASKATEKQNKPGGSSKSGHTRHRLSVVVQLSPLPIQPFRADITPAVRLPPRFLVAPSRRSKH